MDLNGERVGNYKSGGVGGEGHDRGFLDMGSDDVIMVIGGRCRGSDNGLCHVGVSPKSIVRQLIYARPWVFWG